MRKLIRQGDVLLVPIAKLPASLKKHKEQIVARGEATGHDHIIIDGEVLVDESGKLYVVASSETMIRHQDQVGGIADHLPCVLEPGPYKILIEEEYTPEGLRPVVD